MISEEKDKSSMSTAYELVEYSDFPKVKIGKRTYIPHEAFEKWIKNYTGKEYKVK